MPAAEHALGRPSVSAPESDGSTSRFAQAHAAATTSATILW
jgi:hypothetical protein